MKRLPNVISVLRIAGSLGLLFCDVAGWLFWVLYALCGISDMVDGPLARNLQAESKTGAVLDSVADIVFVACCAIRLFPVLEIPVWLCIWAGVIVFIKKPGIGTGYLQTILFSSYIGQQTDRFPAFPDGADTVPVNDSDFHRCCSGYVCRRPGGASYQKEATWKDVFLSRSIVILQV